VWIHCYITVLWNTAPRAEMQKSVHIRASRSAGQFTVSPAIEHSFRSDYQAVRSLWPGHTLTRELSTRNRIEPGASEAAG
jgi:hypothetical protein